MIQKINGKWYDTDDAELIKELPDEGDSPETDPEYVVMQIYQKTDGEYFATVYGGSMTIFCKHECGGYPIAGKWIVPLSDCTCFFKKASLSPKESNTDLEWRALVTQCFEKQHIY